MTLQCNAELISFTFDVYHAVTHHHHHSTLPSSLHDDDLIKVLHDYDHTTFTFCMEPRCRIAVPSARFVRGVGGLNPFPVPLDHPSFHWPLPTGYSQKHQKYIADPPSEIFTTNRVLTVSAQIGMVRLFISVYMASEYILKLIGFIQGSNREPVY